MIRVRDIDSALYFFCKGLGMIEIKRTKHEKGRFTLIFLAAPGDYERAKSHQAPLLELTFNWPDSQNRLETYAIGRHFGHLAYRVDNIYKTCEHLMDLGITIHRPPRDGHMAFVKSPDGVSVELLQKGKPLQPESPWVDIPNSGTW